MIHHTLTGKISLGTLFAGSVLGVTSCGGGAGEKKDVKLPNIVMINVDDLGWTDAACLGSDFYETPNIDKLAEDGKMFTQFYAAAALSSPTRASIMTGKYPARLGLTDWIRARFQPGGKILPEDSPSGFVLDGGKNRMYYTPENPLWMELEEVTIAELLKEAGYTTCHIGKWHLGPEDYFPDKQGFDINIGGCDYGEPPSFFDPYSRGPLPEYDYDSIPGIPGLPSRKPGEYLTDREADEAVSFIREHTAKPFFLNMCHYAVHVPLQAKADLERKYQLKEPGEHHNLPVYAAMVESVDQAVGSILSTLDELNLTGNTIVIFTSDNGGLTKNETTSNYPLRSGKAFPYEGGIRIPLIVRWPGVVQPGTTSDEMLITNDFLPTLCDAANIDLPENQPVDGKSFLGVLQGLEQNPVHENLIWHYPHYRDWDNTVPYSIIRQGNWKMIKWYGEQSPELYNLAEDVGESNDLAGEMPEKVKDLEIKLMARLKEMNARVPYLNPEYK